MCAKKLSTFNKRVLDRDSRPIGEQRALRHAQIHTRTADPSAGQRYLMRMPSASLLALFKSVVLNRAAECRDPKKCGEVERKAGDRVSLRQWHGKLSCTAVVNKPIETVGTATAEAADAAITCGWIQTTRSPRLGPLPKNCPGTCPHHTHPLCHVAVSHFIITVRKVFFTMSTAIWLLAQRAISVTIQAASAVWSFLNVTLTRSARLYLCDLRCGTCP